MLKEWRIETEDGDDVFLGVMKDAEKQGYGQMVRSTGDRVQGRWQDNQLNGLCFLMDSEGHHFFGECSNNLKHGVGRSSVDGYGRWEEGVLVQQDSALWEKCKEIFEKLKNDFLDFEVELEEHNFNPLFDWYADFHKMEPKDVENLALKATDSPHKSRSSRFTHSRKSAQKTPVSQNTGKKQQVGESGNKTQAGEGEENTTDAQEQQQQEKPVYLKRKRSISKNRPIPKEIIRDLKYAKKLSAKETKQKRAKSPILPSPKKRNENFQIYLTNGEKIIPYLENVKKMHKIKSKKGGKEVLVDDPNYVENRKYDLDDTNLLFRQNYAGEIGLEDYADLLEAEKRIEIYYKSYLDRCMRNGPDGVKYKIGERFDYKYNKPGKKKPEDDLPDLWDQFIGDYISGRIYIPGLRPDKDFDDMTPEEKRRYLFNTNYHPPFNRYVTNRLYPSMNQLARDILDAIRNGTFKGDPEAAKKRKADAEARYKELKYASLELLVDPLLPEKYTSPRSKKEFEALKRKLRRDRIKELSENGNRLAKYRLPKSLLANRYGDSGRPRALTPRTRTPNYRRKSRQPRKRTRSITDIRKKPPVGKRWGDYHRVARLYERATLNYRPFCYRLFDPLPENPKERREEWKDRTSRYDFENTKHLYDSRPEAKVLSKRISDKNYSKLFPKIPNQAKTPRSRSRNQSNDSPTKNSKNLTGQIHQKKVGFRRSKQKDISYAMMPIKSPTSRKKKISVVFHSHLIKAQKNSKRRRTGTAKKVYTERQRSRRSWRSRNSKSRSKSRRSRNTSNSRSPLRRTRTSPRVTEFSIY